MRIAFVGGYGHHYLKKLLGDPTLSLEVAVCGDGYDAEAARALASRLAGAQWFETPAAMFDSFAPDAVSIGAVYAFNGDIAALALERDVPVVCDKPVAATWAQLERLRELTQDNSRVLLCEFPFRSQREFRAARAAVESGQIGEVVLATAQKSYRFGNARPAWYGDPAWYPGTLMWIASHGVDAIHFCGGVALGAAQSVGGNLSQPTYAPMEDHVVALFELANGGHAVVHADYLRPAGAPTHGDDRLRIAGTRGVVEVQGGRCTLINGDGETDITQNIEVRPVERELLAAIRGEESVYSTAESLTIAEVLLRAANANATGDAKD